ncbi:carbohydrate binding domain-containing protein [Parafrankia sp. FMc6]|uniref:carbohydrate binding domain-containing protein n=1 Tax=Parafrankia soli TaxID=2599596 RepID=UPI0034D482E0
MAAIGSDTPITSGLLHDDLTPITTSAPLLVDDQSRYPHWRGADDGTKRYRLRVAGGEWTEVAADVQDQADALAERVAAVEPGGDAAALQAGENLADVASAASARTNLGLGTAAVSNASAFDAAGSAAAVAADLAALTPGDIGAQPAAGGTMTGALTLQSSDAGGPDTTDSTSRLTVESYQTNGVNFFGEGFRLDLKKPYSKNMLAWRLPRDVNGGTIMFGANMTFEVDTTGWTPTGGAGIARSSAQKLVGSYSGLVTWATGATGSQSVTQTYSGLTIGRQYTFYRWVYVPTGGSPAVQIDVTGGATGTTSTATNAWQELSVTITATATSHDVRVRNAASATSGQQVHIDLGYGTPELTAPRSVTWIGAHYEAQDFDGVPGLSAVHGHWSIEVPDASDALRTRLEIKFVDADGNIGVDQTLIQTANSHLVVDCSNDNVLRLRSGAGQAKAIEFGNEQWGTLPRWQVRQNGTAEGGSNAGSDFEVARYNDAGTQLDTPIIITRSSGRVTVGNTTGSAGGLDVKRNSTGTALGVQTTATGATGYTHTANDAATSRVWEAKVTGEPGIRAVQYADGKIEVGDGTNSRDVNLYRSAPDVWRTDDSLIVAGASFTAPGFAATTFVRKTANETVNTSATFQDDDHLTATVAANGVYMVEGLLIYDASTTGDIKIQWVAPAGAALDWTTAGLGSGATGAVASVDLTARTLASTPPLGGVGVGTKVAVPFRGLLVVAGTGGTFKLQWAQNSAEATDCTVYSGSHMLLRKVA